MPFTKGYKVNANTQFEFSVSNETLAEVVQGGGITDGDLAEYCYTALIDSRVYRLFAAQGQYSGEGGQMPGWARDACPGIVEGYSSPMTAEHPTFNKSLLEGSDTVYQRNFLVWEGTIYPGTENEKQGTFLVMDMVDIKRWYVNFDDAGFGTTTVTSSIGETPPEGYVWPGYTGDIYTYAPNDFQWPVMHCDNNNPQLNPNTNIKVRNILIVNDEPWIGCLNPGSGSQSYMGGSGCSYAAKSIWGFYWSGSSNGGYLATTGMRGMYQRGSLDFMGLPDYINAPECPGAPRNDIGSLGYSCYAVTNSDSVVVNLAGNWGQQNYASGCSFVNNSATTQLTSVLKWQSWCGLKFQYNNTMYKPIIEGGIIVGYSDDMDAESEYDDMTNVTGNNISPTPPTPPKPAPGHWDDILSAGTFGSTLGFVNAYYISRAQLLALKTWMGKDEASGGPPDGYDMLSAIVGIKMYPWALATSAPDDITIVIPGSQSMWTGLAQRLTLGAILEVLKGDSPSGDAPTPIRTVNSGVKGFATKAGMQQYNLGTLDMNQFMNTQYPFLTYDATVELYIPFVGTFTLDTQAVMGRTLRCYLNLDPGTGGVYGYCMCNNTMIASGTGNIGVDVPISSAQMGIYRAQADTLAAGRMANGVISGLAIAAGMPAIAAAGIGAMYDARGSVDRRGLAQIGFNSALNSLAQGAGRVSTSLAATASNAVTANRSIRQLQQSHGMAMTGSTGGSTVEWCCPWDAYIKIIRPKPHNPGNSYNHAVAVPAYRSGNLSSFKGLTVCIDPDVSGLNATTEERNAIASIMQGGIIV